MKIRMVLTYIIIAWCLCTFGLVNRYGVELLMYVVCSNAIVLFFGLCLGIDITLKGWIEKPNQ